MAQVDRIVAAMRQVLGSMIELEDFNEAIDLLRIDYPIAREGQRPNQEAAETEIAGFVGEIGDVPQAELPSKKQVALQDRKRATAYRELCLPAIGFTEVGWAKVANE